MITLYIFKKNFQSNLTQPTFDGHHIFFLLYESFCKRYNCPIITKLQMDLLNSAMSKEHVFQCCSQINA